MQQQLKPVIATSILGCDFSIFHEECKQLVDQGTDWLHLDIMDGHFVPNLTFGPPIVKSLNSRLNGPSATTRTFLDCHCMVSKPQQWVESLAAAGADQMTVHYESQMDVNDIGRQIREAGMKAALAIKPSTPIDDILIKHLEDKPYDMVLVMTVEPGFGGQKFMADMMPKVRKLRDHFQTLNIQVDGGVSSSNVCQCAEAGANVIVSGNGIMLAEDRVKTILEMRETVAKCIGK